MTARRRNASAHAGQASGAVIYNHVAARGRRVWEGIEAEDPPYFANDYEDLRATAEGMVAAREKRFPAMIERGAIDRASAEAELATYRAIAADWRWICTGEGAPAAADTLTARREALDTSLQTIAEIAREAGDFTTDLSRQAQCVIALRWHLDQLQGPEPRVVALARLTHELRAAMAVCPACERRSEDPARIACTRTDCPLPFRQPAKEAA